MSAIYFQGFNYSQKMNDLRCKAVEEIKGDSFNERHLDTAFNAINLQELDFVITNTTSIAVQDYAMVKRNYFFEVKGMR